MELEDKIVMLGETFVMRTDINSLNKNIIQTSLYNDSMDTDNLLHRFVARQDKKEGDHMREFHNGILSSFVKLFKRSSGDLQKSIDGVDRQACEKQIKQEQVSDNISSDIVDGLKVFIDKNIKDIAILANDKLYFVAKQELAEHEDIEKNLQISTQILLNNTEQIDHLIGEIRVSYFSCPKYKIVLYVLNDSPVDACAIIVDKNKFGQAIKRSEDIISMVNSKLGIE